MKQKIEGLDQAKFILIVGVVLIHICFPDWITPAERECNIGVWGIGNFMHLILNRSVVPLFFMISGMLFFRGMERFTAGVYLGKLRRRVRTLLVPYLVWNTICLLVVWGQWLWCGGSGQGVFDEGTGVDWRHLAQMYWASPAYDGLPCAYAFWFIRNLMVFVVLSPVAWVIGRSATVTVLAVLVCVVMGSTYWYFLWFVIGACMGLHGWRLPRLRYGWMYLLWMPVMLWIGYVARDARGSQWMAALLALTLMAGVAVRYTAEGLWRRRGVPLFRLCVSATFIIYGFHQIVSRQVTEWWMGVTGYGTWYGALATYLCSLVTLVTVSVILYAVMRRWTPGLLRLLTGGRGGTLP